MTDQPQPVEPQRIETGAPDGDPPADDAGHGVPDPLPAEPVVIPADVPVQPGTIANAFRANRRIG